jgi:flagellar biosynthetic protein FliP
MKKIFLLVVLLFSCSVGAMYAQNNTSTGTNTNTNINIPYVNIGIRNANNNQEVALSLQLLLLLSVITLAPSLLILTTAFLRIAIVFNFITRSLSLQYVPPTQVMMGIALFLTLFIMWPTFSAVYDTAFKPFADGQIGIEKMYENAEKPIKAFMWRQLGNDHKNVELFLKLGNYPKPKTKGDVPIHVLIPAFILSELGIAFKIGIMLFIPFIVIDMVVASTLMSMGMIMLPPIMISLPFKLILFVLVDGWSLITMQLVKSFM